MQCRGGLYGLQGVVDEAAKLLPRPARGCFWPIVALPIRSDGIKRSAALSMRIKSIFGWTVRVVPLASWPYRLAPGQARFWHRCG